MTLPTVQTVSAELDAAVTTSDRLTRQALDRINDPDGEGARAFIRLNAQRSLKLAEASDAMRAAGHKRSLLEGLPISVKDLFDVAGERTTAGSLALTHARPAAQDSPVVRRLLSAGAVITGTTNMSEFAFSGIGINPHYGTPRNPFDRATGRIPGGSSSGAAISVTDGMAVAAIGTDTGGSIRIPAALCGLTGFKPTARRVSAEGVVPLSTSLDSIGPIAASVACCAAIDAVLSGNAHLSGRPLPLRGLRLAVPQTVVLSNMDATVAAAFDRALTVLSRHGAHVVEIELPAFSEVAGIYARGGLVAPEAYAWHKDLLENLGDRYDPRVRLRILRGKELSAADYIDALDVRRRWVATVEDQIAGYDALIMPTVPVIAPELGPLIESDEAFFAANGLILRNPTMINFLDGCALSIPCHRGDEAPVGLMVAGAAMKDRTILAVGQAIETALTMAAARD
ncbi:amidase [Rhizobium sp. SSA_523]|uniref:amidase n=1 Tax=Rhizobium sp. SSA_523 TaxID=2952477 RepID=UPI0020914726|nr:amidase [Rhizobium sp. SSA_523]MCO5733279.1 amidase [Rhizobium sp. SSA_523]WKC21736.1 amidase [Rhizobium sp. SSA_523]